MNFSIWKIEWYTEGEVRESISTNCFTLKIHIRTKDSPTKARSKELHLGLLFGWQGPKYLDHHPMCLSGSSARSWIQSMGWPVIRVELTFQYVGIPSVGNLLWLLYFFNLHFCNLIYQFKLSVNLAWVNHLDFFVWPFYKQPNLFSIFFLFVSLINSFVFVFLFFFVFLLFYSVSYKLRDMRCDSILQRTYRSVKGIVHVTFNLLQ